MSFEIVGMTYDPMRKLNTNARNFASDPTNAVIAQYNPVPYNINFSLYVYVRNIEDGNQIIEHILPYFTPDYTIKLNMIPEMGIVKNVPIILDGVMQEVQYEGPREQETRTIIWTLNFTVQGFIFGRASKANIIKNSITNIIQDTSSSVVKFRLNSANSYGSFMIGEYAYQGYSLQSAIATGRVVAFSNNNLTLDMTDIVGNFISNMDIKGSRTNAHYSFNTYDIVPKALAQVSIKPNPLTANANSNYTYTTTILEEPNIP
jgi:hypothetical protein